VTDRIEVLQDVLVLDVTVAGATVVVDVYGSPANACGILRVQLPDTDARRDAVALVRHWGVTNTPLSLIVQGTRVALQNDHAVFQAQLQPMLP
jgi:hypothetical protein